jgi:XTP/dITP diphosphohydrolase
MMELIFATNNQHKADEIMAVLPAGFSVRTLKQAGIDIDIPEPHDTLEENAREKARTIFELKNGDCFSEDTGLEVAALNGRPGVRSARYAGDSSSSAQNIELLLKELGQVSKREAQFRTVICLIRNGQEFYFEGICPGVITLEQTGKAGFGYDPIFIPNGSDKTFAEMDIKEKNMFSHRRKAVDKLVAFLEHSTINK